MGLFHLGTSFEERLCFMNVDFVELISGIKSSRWMKKAEWLNSCRSRPSSATPSAPEPLLPQDRRERVLPPQNGHLSPPKSISPLPCCRGTPCLPPKPCSKGVGDTLGHPSPGRFAGGSPRAASSEHWRTVFNYVGAGACKRPV